MVDVLRSRVASLLHLNHLDRRWRRGGNIDSYKLDWNILRHLDHIWLLSDRHWDLDHLGRTSVVVVVVFMLVVVIVGYLSTGLVCVVLRLGGVERT